MYSVHPVPCRSDNYAYLLVDDETKQAAAVDPYDASKVSAAAEKLGVKIVANITTHHHDDHSGGNLKFSEKYPGITVYGGSNKIPALTKLVKDKDEFTIGGIHVKCLATPCHTQDSICFHFTDSKGSDQPGGVFTGDTLFVGGNGRFFEGTGEEMHSAMQYLGTLPDSTVIYVGHEYTAGNLAFAKSVDASNPVLEKLAKLVKDNEVTTGKSTIGEEKEWNPFMRLDAESIKKATSGTEGSGAVMDKLRELKNNFRG